MVTDSGKEFVSDIFQNFLEKNKIAWKKAIGARHRQVGLVERKKLHDQESDHDVPICRIKFNWKRNN